jgi:probable rRNA maturation factor
VSLSISVQFASKAKHLPTRAQVRRWALAAHRGAGVAADAMVTIRYVDEKEGRALNLQFRGKDYATNVLTFVHDGAPFADESAYSADIVICSPVIAREAREQKKPVAAHHGHMVLHGMLHAQGFDHEDSVEAEAMEAIEIALLRRFRIDNPYETA